MTLRTLFFLVTLLFGGAMIPVHAAGSSATASAFVTTKDKAIDDQIQRLEVELKKIKATRDGGGAAAVTRDDSALTINYVSNFLRKGQEAIKTTVDGLASLSDFGMMGEWLTHELKDPVIRADMMLFLAQLSSIFLVAFFVEQGANITVFKSARSLMSKRATRGPIEKIIISCVTLLLSILPIFVFALVFYIAFKIVASTEMTQYLAKIILRCIVGVRLATRLLVVLLYGFKGMAPLIRINPKSAHITYRFVWRLLMLYVVEFFVLRLASFMDLPASGSWAIIQMARFFSVLLMAAYLAQIRLYLTRYLEGFERKHRRYAHIWLVGLLRNSWYTLTMAALLLSSISWVTATFVELGDFVFKAYVTYLTFPCAVFISHLMRYMRITYLRYILERISRSAAFSLSKYGKSFDYGTSLTVNIGAFYMISRLWLGGYSEWVENSWGKIVTDKILVVAFITAIAIVLMRAVDSILRRYPKHRDDLDEFAQVQVSARIKTVITVTRNALRIAIWIPAVLLIIGELGFDITPVLASLSVLALGFSLGLQSLVKDFVTGFFIIMENIMVVGDEVTIEGKSGVVESLSIRTIRLRDDFGTLHTIPFSAIGAISNNSRDYTFCIVNIQVDFSEDLDRVKVVLQKAFTMLKATHGISRKVFSPFEMRGIDEFNTYCMTVQARIKTAPAQRSVIKREYNRIVRQLFQEEGIRQPASYKEVKLVRN